MLTQHNLPQSYLSIITNFIHSFYLFIVKVAATTLESRSTTETAAAVNDFYEKAQSRLEKTADTLKIETDTEEKKGTKQKRKTAMAFSESDEDIVVGDEELYRRYFFDSSNS
ncbi:uncharacterized protein LOC136087553 [Hydra vulgaris]|uniref:Uncharacterized protein LOC136087553 n=1 Tax=Hydra vulgaris TaxID=6087 RepID=A0ABM4CXR2_HYDVU